MAYRVELRNAARKALGRLDPPVRAIAVAVIDGLSDAPRPPGCKAMSRDSEFRGCWRVEFGPRDGWRIVYRIDDRAQLVTLEAIGLRGDLY